MRRNPPTLRSEKKNKFMFLAAALSAAHFSLCAALGVKLARQADPTSPPSDPTPIPVA